MNARRRRLCGRWLVVSILVGASLRPALKTPQAVDFLKNAVAYYAKLGVTVKRLLTDHGSAFRTHADPSAYCDAAWWYLPPRFSRHSHETDA
jgi:hypothetical protein